MSDANFNATGGLTVGRAQILSIDLNNNASFLTLSSPTSSLGVTSSSSLAVSGASTFSTIPNSLTPAVDNNSTQLATTAYFIAQGSIVAPLMNSVATTGTAIKWARQDHIHPTDTTRSPVLTPTFTNSIAITGATVTTNTPFFSATQTWNNISTTFNGLFVNVTNTASAPASLLLNFQQNSITTFGVTSGGAIIQYVAGSFLARDILANPVELRHIREYQDLDDSPSGTSVVPSQFDATSVSNWSTTFNAIWNPSTLTYTKDRSNNATAIDHAYAARLSEDFKPQWWFSDGTTAGSPISWIKKVEFDLFNSNYTFNGNVISTLTAPTLAAHLVRKDYVDLNFPKALVTSAATAAASGFTSTGGTISLTRTGTIINIESSGIVGGTTMTGDLNVGSPSKFTVAAATGNTTIAGTLNVAGVSTLSSLSVTTFSITGQVTFANAVTTANLSVGGSIGLGVSGGPYTKFTVDSSTGNIASAGTLSVVGTSTLAAVSATTVVLNGVSDLISASITSTTVASQIILQIAANLYRSTDIIIQGSDVNNGKYQTTKLLAIHNGTLVDFNEYGSLNFNGQCGAYSVVITGGFLQILVIPTTTSSTVFKATVIASRV